MKNCKLSVRFLASILVILFVLQSSLFAQTQTEEMTFSPKSIDVTEALESIQNFERDGKAVIVPQGELDSLIREGGGGACPSAAAFIVYQALRSAAGLDFASNPHKQVLSAFSAMPDLLQGRLSNRQFSKLVQYYGDQIQGYSVSIEILSAPNSPHSVDKNIWDSNSLPDLQAKHNQAKVVSYTVTNADGHVLGRHFVLVKNFVADVVNIMNPDAPTKNQSFKIRMEKGLGRVFFDYPPGIKDGGRTNELNTIFNVNLIEKPLAQRFTPVEESTVTSINDRISELANSLQKRGDLKSPTTWRKEGSSFGLSSLDLGSEFGGANWPAKKMIDVFRHAGQFDLNLRDVVGAAHARVLLNSKSVEVRDIVHQIADGKGYMAIAITEPNVGSDFTSMESTAKRVDGGYVLKGHKRFNARLEQASHVIVFTKSPTGNDGRISTFVLPIKTKGLEIEHFEAHGLKGNSYGGLILNDVFVPSSHLIGDEDDGRDIFNSHFRYWRLMQTATAIGTAERALEIMAERLKSRHAFGGPIGRFTHLQQPMGQHTTELRMAYALAKEAADLLDQKEYALADPLINGLKAEGIEIAIKAVDAAARAFGGEGYSNLVDIGDRLQDLNGLRIADGATDVMRSSVVSSVYGKEFWEMAIKGRPSDFVNPDADRK